MRVLIIESSSPELVKVARESGQATVAENYAHALQQLQADLLIQIASPYETPFDTEIYEALDGVVFTGSAAPWSTDALEAKPLRMAMESVFTKAWPGFGSCNGLQLAAVVLGGRVHYSPNGFEVGLAQDLQLTAEGQSHAMMQGRENGFSMPAIHRDEVAELPQGAVTLAYNRHTPHQAMVYEQNGVDFWGTQYHPEMAAADIGRLVKDRTGLFTDHESLAEDLLVAETSEAAAGRLGSSMNALQPAIRMLELRNWLGHIAKDIG